MYLVYTPAFKAATKIVIFHRILFTKNITFVFNMEKKYHDSEFGTITLIRSEQARRYSLRVKDGRIIATRPWRGSDKILLEFLEKNREKLRQALTEQPRLLLHDNTTLHTLTFTVHIFRTDRANFYPTLKDGVLHIACPWNTDFSEEAIQCVLRLMIYREMKAEAKRVLPPRLKELAARHGFTVNAVKLHNNRKNWGCCSPLKIITLSTHLMILPPHLVDYVLLHELCHTVHMNHSKEFWNELDRVTGNQAEALCAELKKYHPFPRS